MVVGEVVMKKTKKKNLKPNHWNGNIVISFPIEKFISSVNE
jgi:hypothetical protein